MHHATEGAISRPQAETYMMEVTNYLLLQSGDQELFSEKHLLEGRLKRRRDSR